MRPTPRYPVDRYMVESSNTEMVNIIDEDLWKPEPTLRPEDEIILRKLHDMLQSTSDDLKLLSGELSKYHEPGVQIKSTPTPLDEEFNEKVHIEEVVNAKFHGHKIIDKPSELNTKVNNVQKSRPKVINTAVQVNSAPSKIKTARNLGMSRTRILQINDKNDNMNAERLNNGKIINTPAVAYNEFSFKYVEPKTKEKELTKLQVQVMPSINIRSELKEQKVLNIDILPDSTVNKELDSKRINIGVVSVHHDEPIKVPVNAESFRKTLDSPIKPVRKVSKMSTCDSSENNSSDAQLRLKLQQKLATALRTSPKNSARTKKGVKIKDQTKNKPRNVDEWKKKLNVLYGASNSKPYKTCKINKETEKKALPKKLNTSERKEKSNNTEYIPYSQLTLGGVKVSDIEKEISDIPDKNRPISQILDKILSSKENSPRNENHKILTTSDENLLQEVIDIERTVSETISRNIKKNGNIRKDVVSSNEDGEGYDDDFEDDKSDDTIQSKEKEHLNDFEHDSDKAEVNSDQEVEQQSQNATFIKASHLSIKESVDIFEFIHSVDTQDTATQSSCANKIIPKETQTSPRNERANIQPIHNDLWPSLDPSGEVEKMLKLEKEFIKKLIIDEYGDLLEKNITKPSTSKENDGEKNIAAFQKNTQTSPARVKSVMTSPKRTKTRTTSPFEQQLTLCVDQQTSPLINDTINIDLGNEDQDITINLSSPRFSLRLPQSSKDAKSIRSLKSSSSSVEAGSSSEVSLGEVRGLRRRLRKSRIPSISESSSTCSGFSGGIIPLRSEGELSVGLRTKLSKPSDGELSFGG